MINKKKSLLYGVILVISVSLGLSAVLSSQPKKRGLRIACNDDAAGLLIKYLAGGDSAALKVVNMSYQQLLDCCSSQTELALAAGNFDLAVLCPNGAENLLAAGQPYQILGAVVVNAIILVTNQDAMPQTVGYMNAREIQKELVWSNYNSSIEMKPMLPAGLPYALERNAVEGIVLDILSALKIGGYRMSLPSEYPTSVLVVHRDLCDSPELISFIEVYNQAVGELNNPEILMSELAKHLAIERGNDEVKAWKEMGVQYQTIKLQS